MQLEAGRHAARAINRGAATIYNGKLFRVTIDNHLLALDMKTGKELWNQKFADCERGLLRDRRADRRQRRADFRHGRRRVHDARIPRRLGSGHRARNCGADTRFPRPASPAPRRGRRTATPGSRAAGRRGAPARTIRSSIWSIGAPATRSRTIRGRARALDSLYTSSVLAIRPKTGEIVCYFQYTPNDVYDVDGTDEHVLADIQVDGQLRKVMIQANKNGFLYVLDRTNCKLIAAHPYVKVNWATHIDLTTGRPVLTDVYKRFLAGEEVEIWPSRGTNAVPIAFNPNTGLIYASTWNMPRIQKLAPPQAAGPRRATRPASSPASPTVKPGDVLGHFAAINPLTGEKKWEVPLTDLPELGRHAGDRRRAGVHRQADGRVRRARRGHRQDAVAVQDRIERQFDGDHLHAQGPAVRDRRVGTRRRSRHSLSPATRCRPADRSGRSR